MYQNWVSIYYLRNDYAPKASHSLVTKITWHFGVTKIKYLEASGQGGVYVISWIKPNLQDKAFSAVETGDPVKQLTIDPRNDHQVSPDQFSQCLHTDMALHNEENSDATDADANNELTKARY